jgi:hypothetical protein
MKRGPITYKIKMYCRDWQQTMMMTMTMTATVMITMRATLTLKKSQANGGIEPDGQGNGRLAA